MNISLATTILSAHDLYLQGLPYDIRLELFSYMKLSPFDGCQDYAGLWLSCRQFHEEADSEGRRQLKMYTDSMSRTPDKVDTEGTTARSSEDEAASSNIEILIPPSVYAQPVIEVNVPFLLPPQGHEWQFQKPPPRMFRRERQHLLATPGPRRDAYFAAREKRNECSKQEELYRQRVAKLLGSIGDLYDLYARVEIHIIADNDATRFIEDPVFDQWLDHADYLHSVVLGKMLKFYLSQIRNESFERMQRWSQGWPVHATQIDITWNFGSTDPTARRVQDPWGSISCLPKATHWRARAEYTADRREGFVQMNFDTRAYMQFELRMRIDQLKGSIAGDETELSGLREAIALDEKRLHSIETEKAPETPKSKNEHTACA